MSVRIAMWSGPRNISTAMMRSWENRRDTAVWDEPLYAYYLAKTGLDHPGREAIIAAGDTDWRTVTARCAHDAPNDCSVFYQKHMTHHVLPEVDLDWLDALHHCLLIRDPRAVLISYSKARESVTLDDIGIVQQVRIYEHLCRHQNAPPPIIDSNDFLQAPERFLRVLCPRLGIDFDERMLRWPAGGRDSDGVWADHWYRSVRQSTGFTAPRSEPTQLPVALEALADAAQAYYDRLYRDRLVVS